MNWSLSLKNSLDCVIDICLHLFIPSPLEGIVVHHFHLQTELEIIMFARCVVWEVLEAVTCLITFIQLLNQIKAKNWNYKQILWLTVYVCLVQELGVFWSNIITTQSKLIIVYSAIYIWQLELEWICNYEQRLFSRYLTSKKIILALWLKLHTFTHNCN